MKKKIPVINANPPAYRLEERLQFLKKLEKESEMIDDHGHMIIGRRDRKPKLDESNQEQEELL